MKILKTLLSLSLILMISEIYGQALPETYPTIFSEMITNFESIRSGNSIKKGKSTLTVFSEKRIVLRITHKKQVKNLTFIKELDTENNLHWIAKNQLTIDMVNKYEEDLSDILKDMLELSLKKAKE
jgi:hypothetical protein